MLNIVQFTVKRYSINSFYRNYFFDENQKEEKENQKVHEEYSDGKRKKRVLKQPDIPHMLFWYIMQQEIV